MGWLGLPVGALHKMQTCAWTVFMHSAPLQAVPHSVNHTMLPSTPPSCSKPSGGRSDDASALRFRLDKAERAVEAERRAVQVRRGDWRAAGAVLMPLRAVLLHCTSCTAQPAGKHSSVRPALRPATILACLQDLQRQLRANEQAAVEGREAMQAALELRHK